MRHRGSFTCLYWVYDHASVHRMHQLSCLAFAQGSTLSAQHQVPVLIVSSSSAQ